MTSPQPLTPTVTPNPHPHPPPGLPASPAASRDPSSPRSVPPAARRAPRAVHPGRVAAPSAWRAWNPAMPRSQNQEQWEGSSPWKISGFNVFFADFWHEK